MELFKIEVQEFLSKIVEIEAENADNAILKVIEMYRDEEIVLDASNYVTTEINEYRDE